MNLDWFQPFKYTQHSTGAIYASICNFPRAEKNKSENILYLGFLPGPKEVSLKQFNYYLVPIVDELKDLWDGWKIPKTYNNIEGLKIRVAVIIELSDIPTMQKLFGYASVLKKCYQCPIRSQYSKEYKKNHYGRIDNYQTWITQPADPQLHREYV